MIIRAYVNYSERSNTHFWQNFKVVDKLPKVGDVVKDDLDELGVVIAVNPVALDCEQGNDKVYDYDYFHVKTEFREKDNDGHVKDNDPDSIICGESIAVKKEVII